MQDKLKIEVDKYNNLKEEQRRLTEYLKNIEKDILVVQGRISILNELMEFISNQEQNSISMEKIQKENIDSTK